MRLRWKLARQARKAARFKSKLGAHVTALLVESENGVFAVDPEDFVVGRRLRRKGKYGADEISRLKKFVSPQSRVLVVGAHIGSVAIPLARVCKEVIAIEANPLTFGLLEKNLALNKVENCQTIQIAASSKEEEIEFLLSRANSGGSKRVPLITEYMYYYDNPESVMVKAKKLDDVLEDKKFDLVIMDIEGSEYFALQGMPDVLAHVDTLAVEFLPHHLRNVGGIGVEEFLAVIPEHLSMLFIPSKDTTLERKDFQAYLTDMYQKDEGDDGIIFQRSG